MTSCNRCKRKFDNYFNGVHWCPYCGKQFMVDENLFKKQEEKKK